MTIRYEYSINSADFLAGMVTMRVTDGVTDIRRRVPDDLPWAFHSGYLSQLIDEFEAKTGKTVEF